MGMSRFLRCLPALALCAATTLPRAASGAAPATAGIHPTIIDWSLNVAAIKSSCAARIARARKRVTALVARPGARTFANSVLALENINADLDDDLAAQTFLSEVSPDKDIRQASLDCSNDVSGFQTDEDADPGLYRALSAGAAAHTEHTPYDRKLTELWLIALRRSGAALPAAQRAEFVRSSKRITDLQLQFTQNIANDTTTLSVAKDQAAGLPADLLATLKTTPDGAYVLPVNDSTESAVLDDASNADTRKRYYFAYFNRQVPKNVDLLQETIAARDRLAHLMGSPSWAAYQLLPRSVRTPQRVEAFLTQLDAHLLPKAKAEFAELAALKATQTGVAGATLDSWDVSYYRTQLSKTRYAVDQNEIKQYFPAQHTVDAILAIYQHILGVTFTQVTPANAWYPDVTEYAVSDTASGRFLGSFLLDLFPRAGKPGGAFNAPILPVRTIDGRNRPPVSSIIVSDWPAAAPGKPALLTHDDVTTFFHEFGHNMAAILAEVPYETLTSFQIDFVEAPSQMLENFTWDRSILKQISSNVDTGAPLPDALIDKMLVARCASDRICNAWASVSQTFLALVDFAYHSSGPHVDTTAVWHRLSAQDTPLGNPPGVSPEAGFTHLMGGYDAGYYAYMWSLVYAQDMFTAFQKGGLESPVVGMHYRKTILAPAGTYDPDVEIKNFLGRPMSPAAFYAGFDHGM
jgi:thimet oligopeptidase